MIAKRACIQSMQLARSPQEAWRILGVVFRWLEFRWLVVRCVRKSPVKFFPRMAEPGHGCCSVKKFIRRPALPSVGLSKRGSLAASDQWHLGGHDRDRLHVGI